MEDGEGTPGNNGVRPLATVCCLFLSQLSLLTLILNDLNGSSWLKFTIFVCLLVPCFEVSLIVTTEPLFAAVAAVCCIGETFSLGDCVGLGHRLCITFSLFELLLHASMLKFVWQHFVIILLSLIIISTYFNWGGLFIMAALLCNEPLVRWLSQTTQTLQLCWRQITNTHTTHHAQTNNVNHNHPPCISLLELPSNSAVLVEWHPPPASSPASPTHCWGCGRDKWWHEWSETDDGNEERFERLLNFNLLDLLDVRSEQMPLEFFSAWASTMHVQFAVHAAYSCAFSWWNILLALNHGSFARTNSVGTTSSNIIGTYNIKLFPAHFCSVAPFRFDAPEAKVPECLNRINRNSLRVHCSDCLNFSIGNSRFTIQWKDEITEMERWLIQGSIQLNGSKWDLRERNSFRTLEQNDTNDANGCSHCSRCLPLHSLIGRNDLHALVECISCMATFSALAGGGSILCKQEWYHKSWKKCWP